MFKVGDRVKCLDAEDTGGCLKMGAVYTVKGVNPHGEVFFGDRVEGLGWSPHRFELVSRDTSVQEFFGLSDEDVRAVEERVKLAEHAQLTAALVVARGDAAQRERLRAIVDADDQRVHLAALEAEGCTVLDSERWEAESARDVAIDAARKELGE